MDFTQEPGDISPIPSANPLIRKIGADEWPTLREIRLRALEQSPDHIGGDIEVERGWGEEDWRAQLAKYDFILAKIDGENAGGMNIEKLEGDFGATCWIGSCWVDEKFRGRKLFRAMINFVDSNASVEGWQVQGLGVWQDNFSAIAIYEQLGFIQMGPPVPSSRRPERFYQRMIRDSAEVLSKNSK